jgi:cell division protein FtsW
MKQPNFGETIIFAAAWVMLAPCRARRLRMLGCSRWRAWSASSSLISSMTWRRPHRRLPVRRGRHLPDRECDAHAHRGRAVRDGAGRRHAQVRLPEPHTDYIFSVIGEEFGLIACLAIACLYLVIVARVLIKLLDEEDKFVILAAAGLVCQFGLQALINMAVNVQIAPSKGMTLPFISYGGSSMLALSIGMGLLLAFTRRNPYLTARLMS